MGRFSWSDKRTVEDCLHISVFKMREWGHFKGLDENRCISGNITWSNSYGEVKSNIEYSLKIGSHEGTITLQYTWTHPYTEEKEEIEYTVPLVTTSCNFGGKRWWFICPVHANGVYCGKRVAKLYISSGSRYFTCRHCLGLTYTSCQESHKFDRLACDMGLSPSALKRVFKRRL